MSFELRSLIALAGFVAWTTISFGNLAHAEDIRGRASVIDGATIEIHGIRIRLHGIDAPESSQTCNVSGRIWRCGQEAAFQLARFLANKQVVCHPLSID